MTTDVYSQREVNELSLSVQRDDREVVVSAWVHNPAAGPAFVITDLLAASGGGPDLLGALRRALGELPADAATAMWGVSLPNDEGRVPASFTMSVMLGRAPSPGAPLEQNPLDPAESAWENAEVVPFRLVGRPGQRQTRVVSSPAVDGTTTAMLTTAYVAGTPHGVLTLAFGTPHVDFLDVFRALFDRIASGVQMVAVTPAPAS